MNKKKHFREASLHLMLLPAVILVLIYSYGPMIGIVISFQDFIPSKGLFGSQWIGLDNFKYIFDMPDIFQVLWNTVFIATMKMLANIVVPVVFALLLNEVNQQFFKRSMQTLIYLPNFLSWVILSGILIDILSPSSGIINLLISNLGMKPIFFLGDPKWFPFTIVFTDVWKTFGFGTIIYLATLTSIDPCLYESSVIDGAGRWKQTIHITLPGLKAIIVLMTVLSLGNVLNAGFDQIFNLYNTQVYSTGDILDTLVYRMGIEQAQYATATAVGLFKSVVSLILISLSYKLAEKYANYRIF